MSEIGGDHVWPRPAALEADALGHGVEGVADGVGAVEQPLLHQLQLLDTGLQKTKVQRGLELFVFPSLSPVPSLAGWTW